MLNKAILMGRLTRDPELRNTATGTQVANFGLAVDRRFTRQGEQKETDFFNIVCFGKQAEFVSRYFRKGQLVAVSGRIQIRDWTDKEGNKRTTCEIIAEETFFAERKNPDAGSSYGAGTYTPPTAALMGDLPQASGTADFAEISGDDEDLPF